MSNQLRNQYNLTNQLQSQYNNKTHYNFFENQIFRALGNPFLFHKFCFIFPKFCVFCLNFSGFRSNGLIMLIIKKHVQSIEFIEQFNSFIIAVIGPGKCCFLLLSVNNNNNSNLYKKNWVIKWRYKTLTI